MVLGARPVLDGGRGGEPGEGGVGGHGGVGGKGGKPWVGEVGTGAREVRTAGGRAGAAGRTGGSGEKGWVGEPGRDGEFRIEVAGGGVGGGLAVYPWRFDLELCEDGFAIWDECGYGLLEPGTRGLLRYCLRNVGGMPTPVYGDVVCSVRENEKVVPLPVPDEKGYGAVALPRGVPAGAVVELPSAVHFLVSNAQMPAIGAPYAEVVELEHRATVGRINAEMPLVADQVSRLAVRHALELLPMRGHVCAVAGGEALVLVRVRNISERAIGLGAAGAPRAAQLRHVGFNFEKEDVRDDWLGMVGTSLDEARHVRGAEVLPHSAFEVAPVNETGEGSFVTAHPGLARPLRALGPGEERVVACSVRMGALPRDGTVDVAPRAASSKRSSPRFTVAAGWHAQACVQTVLDLGHPRDLEAARSVQIRPFQVQLAEPFLYVPGVSKVLLVVNNRTTSAEVEGWRRLAGEVMDCAKTECVSVWNASLYGGVSLMHSLPFTFGNFAETRSLAAMFGSSDQVVVFLNNLCTPGGISDGSDEEYLLPSVQYLELMQACRDFKCRIYVYGAGAGELRSRMLIPVERSRRREFVDEAALLSDAARVMRPDFAPAVLEELSRDEPRLSHAAWMHAEMRGILLKVCSSGRGKRRRWFMLREGQLVYFDRVDAKVPKASFPLVDCSIVEAETGAEAVTVLSISTPERMLILKDFPRTKRKPGFGDPSLPTWRLALENAIASARAAATGPLRESSAASTTGPNMYCSVQVRKRRSGGADATLKSKAEALAGQLQMQYPEVTWHVAYQPPLEFSTSRGLGGVFRKRNVGDISVRMGLLSSDGNVVSSLYGESDDAAFVHSEVSSERNRYGFLKALSLSMKLHLLGNARDDGTLGDVDGSSTSLHFLVDAVSSDVADEYASFRFGYVAATDAVVSAVRVKKRASDVDVWSSRMQVLSTVVNDTSFAGVQSGTVKYAQHFRLLATLRLLVSRSLPLRDAALKTSRPGIIARAASSLLDKMTAKFCTALNLEKASMLKNSDGMTIDKLVSAMVKRGLEDGHGRMGRDDILTVLRRRHGAGVVESSQHAGVCKPIVMSAEEFEGARAAAESSQQPALSDDLRPRCFPTASTRKHALEEFELN